MVIIPTNCYLCRESKKDKYEIKINQTFLSRLHDAADWLLEHDGKKSPH